MPPPEKIIKKTAVSPEKAITKKVPTRPKAPVKPKTAKQKIEVKVAEKQIRPSRQNISQVDPGPVKAAPAKKSSRKQDLSKKINNMPEKTARPRPINLYRKMAFSFIFLTFLLLIIVFYFSFVNLTITIVPSQEIINNELTIEVYDKDNANQDALSQGAVIGVVQEVEVENRSTYQASGTEIIGQEVTGKVTIINNYNKNQPLVATTRLLSPDNKLYRINQTVNVPAGGSLEVEIYADKPDESMAIEPTRFIIPGLWAGLQDKIYATSKEKFVYGQQVKKYIEQVDIDQAVKDLKRGLPQIAESDLSDNYQAYGEIIYKIDENSISTEVDGKVGEEKDKFNVSIKTKVAVVAFKTGDIAKIAQSKIITLVPDNKELIGFNKNEFVFDLDSYNVSQGVARVEATFNGVMVLKDEAEIIDRQKIIGLTQEQLVDYLDDFNEIESYEIKFFPSFIDKVPSLVDRIKVEVRR